MECSEALILLSGHLDGQNSPQQEAALQAHLDHCPDCRKILLDYEDTDRRLAALNAPVPENLSSSVMANIRAVPVKKKTHRPWIGIGTATGLVAAVLVLLIGTNMIKLPKLSDNVSGKTEQAGASTLLADDTFAGMPDSDGSFFDDAETSVVSQSATTSVTASASDETAFQEVSKSSSSDPPLRSPHSSVPFSSQVLQSCTTLSEDSFAAVLLYSGFDTSFFTWLNDYAPELSVQLTVYSEAVTDPQTGIITVTSNYTTVCALHEWFKHVLLSNDADIVPEGDLLDEIQSQFSLYGLDGSHLAKVYSFPDNYSVSAWPENWPEDFVSNWLCGGNWRLFYPEENYTPDAEDLAFLVLIPPQ